ncbi:MAG: hypothetical protein V1726_04310 [Methanobacteriota archaeon]
MKGKIVIGSTLAVIIVLAGFSSIASAQTTESNTFFQQIKDKIENTPWQPGDFFFMIIYVFLVIIHVLKSGPPP